MSKTEEYLDSLLNNVSPEKKAEADKKKRRTSADFMRDFESELEDADVDDVFSDLESEPLQPQKEDEADAGFFDNIEGIVNTANEASAKSQKPAEEGAFEVNTLEDDSWTEPKESEQKTEEKEEAVSEEVQELMDILNDVPSGEEISNAAGRGTIMQQDDDESVGLEADPEADAKPDEKKKNGKEKKGFFQ